MHLRGSRDVYSKGHTVNRPLSVDGSEQTARQRRLLSRHLVEADKDDPLNTLAIAAAAGLLVGGGVGSHAGRTMLACLGRMVAPAAALNFVAGIAMGNHDSTRRADFEN